jgi:hypothetical protein
MLLFLILLLISPNLLSFCEKKVIIFNSIPSIGEPTIRLSPFQNDNLLKLYEINLLAHLLLKVTIEQPMGG